MLHKWRNYSQADPACQDGDVFEFCNLAQMAPWTEVCRGRCGLQFRNCNLLNCKLPADARVESCQTAQVERNKIVSEVQIDGEAFQVIEDVPIGRGVI